MSEETSVTEILDGCSLNKVPAGALRGYFDGTVIASDDMPLNPTPDEVVIYRRKPELKARAKQLKINLLALEGGRPYVNARLSRFAGETEIDWIGGKRPDGSCSTGRLQQTHSFPYLGRIAGKINQYVFSDAPVREGADEDFLKDATRDGTSVNDLMREVSDHIFACKWCWIGVDAPARKSDGTQYTQAEKEALKIRPYWQVYSPLDVLDWHFDERGNLVWIKTQRIKLDDSNPQSVSSAKRIISLWEAGKVTEYTVNEFKDARYRTGSRLSVSKVEIPLTTNKGTPLSVVPFTLVGKASAKPIAFDDLESINRTIMDLGSVSRANFFNANYPQLVLPASLMQRAQQDGYAKNIAEVGRLILGFKYPVLLAKDDPEPKYLMPDSSALTVGQEIVKSLKRELFEVVGLALEQESRQVASAESKAWDFMDVAAVMCARAETLEDSEKNAIEISQSWDDTFQAWTPKYNRDFDVGNFVEDIQALVLAGSVPAPSSVSREIARKLVDRLDRVGSQSSPEEMQAMKDDISTWDPNSFSSILALPTPGVGQQ